MRKQWLLSSSDEYGFAERHLPNKITHKLENVLWRVLCRKRRWRTGLCIAFSNRCVCCRDYGGISGRNVCGAEYSVRARLFARKWISFLEYSSDRYIINFYERMLPAIANVLCASYILSIGSVIIPSYPTTMLIYN